MTGGTISIWAAAAALLACSGSDTRAAPESTQALVSTHAPVYLALGDSVPFGWSDALGAITQKPWRFQGYPKLLASALDLPLLDAACPSEASGSFVSADAPDDGCRAYKASHDLHVDYAGTQLDYALEVVRSHPRLELVTLQVGANDLQIVGKSCGGDPACIVSALPAALQETVAHVVTIVANLRAAGYAGQIVLIDYYSPDAGQALLIQALDGALAQAAAYPGLGVDSVDLYGPFGSDPCAAGLIAKVDGRCEIHPSRAGHELIASLVAQVVSP